MDEPEFENPPMVIDRKGRIFTKTSAANWRYTRVKANGHTDVFDMTWDYVEEFCAGLETYVPPPPAPEPAP
jgi:hypothetical protein